MYISINFKLKTTIKQIKIIFVELVNIFVTSFEEVHG